MKHKYLGVMLIFLLWRLKQERTWIYIYRYCYKQCEKMYLSINMIQKSAVGSQIAFTWCMICFIEGNMVWPGQDIKWPLLNSWIVLIVLKKLQGYE